MALALFSCTKIENKPAGNLVSSKFAALSSGCTSHAIIDDMPIVNTDGDSTDLLTILGAQRTNPYTVANMSRAYTNLGLTNVSPWFTSLYNAEVEEIITSTKSYQPYGIGTDANSPIIALGESWAYYMGHYLADKTYGTNGSCQKEQTGGSTWCNTSGTLHPHIDVEENFNPILSSDVFKWIPQGLYQDLRDVTNENFPIIDNVSNYTNQQMFNNFQSNISTLQNYKIRLLQTTSNSTSASVTNLFSQYGY